MKPWVVFVLLACLLTPSSALAEWVITDEKTEVRASFSLDEPSTAKPAPGGGYFLGDGPTILKPEGLPEPTNPEPTPPATPATTSKPDAAAPSTPPAAIRGDYTVGSIYGPRLTAKELERLREEVKQAMDACIREGMTEGEKIVALVDYLCDACAYADHYTGNANNAYGALIEGAAQCSGYARAFKALCDGAGIGCRYVHAAPDDPINPNHQWCMVEYSGQWYHIDPQMIDDYIRIENGKVTYPRPIVLMAGHLTYQPSGLPNTAERDIVLR